MPCGFQAFLKMPSARRMKIKATAPITATMKRRMPPIGASPRAPAAQKPMKEPAIPTSTLAIMPICALVFMTMLASQPTMPPTIKVMSQPIASLPS